MTIDLINREPWTIDAKCYGEDTANYETRNLPQGAPRAAIATRLCADCPVLNQCGQYALDHPDTLGVVMAGIAYPDDDTHPERIRATRKAIATKIGVPHTPTPKPNNHHGTTAVAGGGLINATKTHCKHGHEFTHENTRLRKDHKGRTARRCRTCDTKYDRDRKTAQRANAA